MTSSDPDKRLHEAASQGDEALMQAALDEGADIDSINDFGSTPLICAVTDGHLNAVRFLVAQGAALEHRSKYGISALDQAVSWEHPAVVTFLLEVGAQVDGSDERGTTPLMIAAARGNLSIVKMLLDKGADPSHRDVDGWNAWDCATEKSEEETAAYLAETQPRPVPDTPPEKKHGH